MATDEAGVATESDLERTVGFVGALTIGVGTMIGAGIFVFPGLAAGRAGPAASVSFAIGAVIALLVALPTAELATAMPKSGGGYYFVSRSMGALAGAIVGIGLCFGLLFASAFYLVGLGEYALTTLLEAGVVETERATVGPFPLAVFAGGAAGLLLTAVSISGTEHTESIQNAVVGVLLAILAVLLSVSALDVVGIRGDPSLPAAFAPRGFGPVLTTAALVFTSYLGFAQIATVAEDVVEPDRTLPRSMVGSVLLVGILYVVTILIAASTFDPGTIAGMGETAIVEVARAYLGSIGVLGILVGGLLATLSSANASILGASRVIYALSSDALAPPAGARLSRKYGTPHFALSFVGGVAVLLVGSGRTEILAEVASFLHLVMYGLICVSLLVLRRSDPDWYDPSFESPGSPLVPALGAVASFGLTAFMQPLSQLLGAVVVAGAAVWYYVHGAETSLKGALES
ncbi:amino acid/polyamine/organocation transporter, APC superfamily [Halobiforma haloterrestris]|uniref:Amino acid/polyamine/organocation transporter, APC superfamily n=1 Tax=Natronobacterium haloterrestre TaxID=148448 RepID=A0A1I1EA83_NATHA|nr:APC family permease [Halobiforma haloterrestris]SFB81863.1 amino acid/polyamine/organocation transporter, APC superfamily [Halobiforma haloterrestris]